MTDLFRKSLNLLLRRQTNILSAAFVIMGTVVVSQILGVLRERLLVSIFGASNTLGIYNYSMILPDTLFLLIVASALSTAFIPVYSDYLAKHKEIEAQKVASTLLAAFLIIFFILSVILIIFAPQVLTIFNLGGKFTEQQVLLMANLMRIAVFGQLIFIIATFFTALLQSYNHFFLPGVAAASYNLGIILGILMFHPLAGIYAAPIGVILGALIFCLVQLPLITKLGFRFEPSLAYLRSEGFRRILKLMWPRTIQNFIQQLGTLALAIFITLLIDPGRMKLLFDYARTLTFAPVMLFGISIAQAAFPILSREKDRIDDFKQTFISSFNQMLYIILPISAIILILRIPIVRLAYGADAFDWEATVLTGRILAYISISIFAQALIELVNRAFYSLQDSKTPLIVSTVTTAFLIIFTYLLIIYTPMGIEGVALAFTVKNILHFVIMFIILDIRVQRFNKPALLSTALKFLVATVFTGFALYIPIKLLDQLVFDTTRTINLIILTGISSMAGLSLYLFLTWLFNIKEATTYILLFKKVGNWREILDRSDEVIDSTRRT